MSAEKAVCRFHGIVQPWNQVSANRRPQCLVCAEPLLSTRPSVWRHQSDPKATLSDACVTGDKS